MSKNEDGKSMGGQDDGALVRSARRGELAAFGVLVERYQRRANALAYRLLSNRDEAMETVQDALLKAYDKLDSLAEPERFGSWLLRIVSNLSLNRRRARALRRTMPLEGPDDDGEGRGEMSHPDPKAASPAAEASARDLEQLIQHCLDELPEMQRQALVLFSMQQMPQKEVAEILGCSVEAVKWHVFTARKKLKDKLKDYL